MGIKSLFIKSDDEENGSNKQESKKTKVNDVEKISFPTKEEKQTSFPTKQTASIEDEMFSSPKSRVTPTSTPKVEESPKPIFNGTNPFIDEINKLYEDGFNKLNKEGVDFYEFYQSIKVGGIDNVAAYPMAFNMCKGMNPNFTKESAIADGEDYIASIEDAYNKYSSSGENKLNEISLEKEEEESSLKTEVSELQDEIDRLSSLLKSKKGELNSIEGKYKDKINSITLKLDANKIVKSNFITNINKVITNIKNNL